MMEEKKLIDLNLNGSKIFVWSADDWLRLREEFRIIGECIGCLAKYPRQNTLAGLPMILLPEEAKLLVDLGVARIVHNSKLQEPPDDAFKEKFEQYRAKLFIKQAECLRDQRKLQLDSVMDKIIDGKKRKLLGLQTSKKKLRKPIDEELKKSMNSINIDRNALMEEELAKLPKLDRSEALVQTHTTYQGIENSIEPITDWAYPSSKEEEIRYKVFKDLWEQGYYVTSGIKFGCDFLAYPGDPIMFHSQFLIHCQDRYQEMAITELIAKSRMSTNVRKTLVFAMKTKNEEDIEYLSSRWFFSAMHDV